MNQKIPAPPRTSKYRTFRPPQSWTSVSSGSSSTTNELKLRKAVPGVQLVYNKDQVLSPSSTTVTLSQNQQLGGKAMKMIDVPRLSNSEQSKTNYDLTYSRCNHGNQTLAVTTVSMSVNVDWQRSEKSCSIVTTISPNYLRDYGKLFEHFNVKFKNNIQ